MENTNGVIKDQNDLLELTQSQLLFWIGQKLNSGKPLYNMPLVFEFNTSIDIDRFQKAFQLLVDKSDTLRIVFEETNDTPFQKILPPYEVQLQFIDWSQESLADTLYKNWLAEHIIIDFDPAQPLYESALIKFSEDKYIWYLNQHHLITDAWAVSVLYKNMATIYAGLGENTSLSSVSFSSFRDFISFEKKNQFDLKVSGIADYWTKKLEQLPHPPRFYGSEGHEEPTTRSIRVSLDIGLERSEKLRTIALEKGIRSWTMHLSLFNIFSTLLFAFIHRISGQQQLSIGTPAHNRPTKLHKETAGVFIEVFPLMVDIMKSDTFLTLLKKVQIETNAFLKNAQPGAAKSALSRSYNVVLNYINAAFSDFDGVSVQSEWVHSGHVDPHHPLRLQVYDFDVSGKIQLKFDLNENVFDEETRDRVPQHFLKLLDAFIESRDSLVSAPQILTGDEYQQFVVDFNRTTDLPKPTANLIQQFEQVVKTSPEKLACSFEDQTLSYEQLNEQANRLANYLKKSGVNQGSRVALFMERSPALIIAILGILKAGATFVPVAANYPVNRVEYMLKDAQVDLVLTNKYQDTPPLKSDTPVIYLDTEWGSVLKEESVFVTANLQPEDLAYIMYTSGSTGDPKGVMISHAAIANYIQFAKKTYVTTQDPVFPLFTMIGFDLTITSIFVPLVSGGTIKVYKESTSSTDLSVLDVIKENEVDIIKLTPSHLELLKGMDLKKSRIKTMIVGGEAFRPVLARQIYDSFHPNLRIYNEYGPTEASVGCVVHQLDPTVVYDHNIPIGRPIPNLQVYVLDEKLNPVPKGVLGELYISGHGLAKGYWNKPALSTERFIENPFIPGTKMYRTGDYVKLNHSGELVYSGRKDHQVKIGGIRIELGEIEAALSQQPMIQECVVMTREVKVKNADLIDCYCTQCGLPSNYPDSVFDEAGVCNLCKSFESYQRKARQYFKSKDDLQLEFENAKKTNEGPYDCMMLLSGGKDSSYALGQLVDMGLKVLAFTLDNGYISDQAKDNVRRVVTDLGVDHIFGETPAMNEIFVDSLKRYSNVCNGCFKVLYTLSTKIALEKDIPYIVTGLSRGQFFETRLTEELFWKDEVDIGRIDEIILNARKAYHRVEDAVSQFLDVSFFEDDQVFEKVKFLDFYRYCDVSMDEMMSYLDTHLPWIRPTDTGRSTNCLINQVGIYVHKKEQGFSNYAFPYSWDVRLGHKERDAALEEINEEIDVPEVQKIMAEIGYIENTEKAEASSQIIAFYTGVKVSSTELKKALAAHLPAYMIPSHFRFLTTMPLTSNGKVDRQTLSTDLESSKIEIDVPYDAPRNQIEEMLTEMWSEVLGFPKVGIHYAFLDLGGNSLSAIRLIARINEAFNLDLPLNSIFDRPTIASLANYIEETIMVLMDE
jgi:amino acid adenylation domain-containing protein